MTPGIDPRSVPHLEADLDRVRDVLGLTHIPDRADLAPLTRGQEGSRRLVRPTLALLSYYVLTDPAEPAGDRAIRAAAAVELLHMGSLYHDDVIDHAPLRRGRPSANTLWGTQLAVLGGDFVTIRAFRLLAELGQHEAVVAAAATERMCAGMVIEAADRYLTSRSEASYLEAIGGKTAALLSVACRLGAMQAGRGEEQEEALARFGWDLGLAYQLRDDILDLTASAEQIGKPANTDLSEGIYTLPVIRALTRDPALGRLLRRGMTAEDAARARERVIASGAITEAQAMADALTHEAIGRLSALTDHPPARQALTAFAHAVLTPPDSIAAPSLPAEQPPAAFINPHRQQVQEGLNAWLLETGLAANRDEVAHYRWADTARMTAAMWPEASAGQLEMFSRALLSILVVDDLFEDPELVDPQDIAALRHGLTVMVRQDPAAPQIHGAVARAWAQAWPRLGEGRTAAWRERILDHITEWFEACEREAHHRIRGFLPAVSDYLPLKEAAGGLAAFVDMFEVTCGQELPPSLRNHPLFRRVLHLGAAASFMENDLLSLEQDEADGAPYNLIKMVQHESGCTRQEAIDQVTRQSEEQYAQVRAILRYAPALFRASPSASTDPAALPLVKDLLVHLLDWRGAMQSDRYRPTITPEKRDLKRLRREICRSAMAPISTER